MGCSKRLALSNSGVRFPPIRFHVWSSSSALILLPWVPDLCECCYALEKCQSWWVGQGKDVCQAVRRKVFFLEKDSGGVRLRA